LGTLLHLPIHVSNTFQCFKGSKADQNRHGDSWAAKVLAAVTLSLFTGVLAFFTFKIWQAARRLKAMEGDASGLYDNKDFWLKYSLFYDSYKKDFWWLFVPTIIYMFAKGCVLAAADGHGLTQTIAQLVIECLSKWRTFPRFAYQTNRNLVLGLLLWNRPYERKSGNVINIVIQVVRALSVVCILVFVEELGISQTTQTVTGVVLIAVQSALTAVLAILIAVNAIIMCCKENPHRKRRKELEKLRDLDNLTPLDARNSLLMDPTRMPHPGYENDPKYPLVKQQTPDSYMNESGYSNATPLRPFTPGSQRGFVPTPRPYTPQGHRPMQHSIESEEHLLRGQSPPRQPTLPQLQNYREYRGAGY
jgi:hypothetical protein